MRLNARLDDEHARYVNELMQLTGTSVSDVVRVAIERYYVEVNRAERGALRVLKEVGFIGCVEGPPDLSQRYKEELTESIAEKYGHR